MNLTALIANIIIILIILSAIIIPKVLEEDDEETDPGTPEKPFIDYPLEEVFEFRTFDMKTNESYNSSWGVFRRAQGGNCCEHYLAPTHDGWITNLGGEYPTWSKDRGVTWDDYRPITEPIDYLGEGSLVETPDGDIIATGWFPYTGDKLIGFYYNRDSDSWSWFENNDHSPFYDRAWQTVVPGPIFSQGNTFPWASFVTSNFWRSAELGYTISLDGLKYTQYPDPRSIPGLDTVSFPIDTSPDEMWDYIIPIREMYAMPLLHDGGVLFPDYFGAGDHAYLDKNLLWHHYEMPQGTSIPGHQHLQIDSSGAMHSVDRVGEELIYHLSLDGGATWTSQNFSWPGASRIEEWEFRAHGEKELAVINMRVQAGDADQDIVWHIRDYRESIEPDSVTLIGLGDLDAISGAGNPVRFDFASLIVLPDGGSVVSFFDSTDDTPLFALELEMPYSDNPYQDLIV